MLRAVGATVSLDVLIVDIKLRTFPSRDREFSTYASDAWEAMSSPPTQEALQRVMRLRYPAAIVIAQSDFARHGEGPIIWYVFRTATLGAPPVDDEAPEAWAVLDDERTFVEVSPELAAIAELPARMMVGHRIEEFSNPNDPTIREDIARLWEHFTESRSIASTLRFNYSDGRPRELGYRLVADAAGTGRHRLTVRVLPGAPDDVDPARLRRRRRGDSKAGGRC